MTHSEVEIEALRYRVKQLEEEIERLTEENQKIVRYVLMQNLVHKVSERPGITSEQDANVARVWDELERTEKDARAYIRGVLAAQDELRLSKGQGAIYPRGRGTH